MSNRRYCYELACDLGLAESVIISQFYFWLSSYANSPEKHRDNFRDGRWWVFNSLRKWHSEQFNFISFSTFTDSRAGKKGKLEKLREAGYLVKSEKDYNKRFKGQNSTSWYTVDLQKLHCDYPYTIKDFPDLPIPNFADCTENPDNSCTENPHSTVRKFQTPCTENPDNSCTENPDNNTLYNLPYKKENSNLLPYNEDKDSLSDKEEVKTDSEIKSGLSSNLQTVKHILETDGSYSQIAQGRKQLFSEFFGKYFEEYKRCRGVEHPTVSKKSMKNAFDNVRKTEAHEHPEIIPLYFSSEFKPKENKNNLKYGKGLKECDYRIYHFTSIGVLQGMLKQLEENRKPETLPFDTSEEEQEEMTDEEWQKMMDDSNEQTRQEQEEPHNTEQTSDNPTCTERKREPIYSVMDNNKDLCIPIENDEILPFL